MPAVTMTGGSSADIGGSEGVRPTGAGVTVHGSRNTDLQQMANGLSLTNFHTGSSPQGVANTAQYQEIAIDFAAGDAEQALSGVRMNLIPAEGGNVLHGTVLTAFMTDSLQDSNYSAELQQRGLAARTSSSDLGCQPHASAVPSNGQALVLCHRPPYGIVEIPLQSSRTERRQRECGRMSRTRRAGRHQRVNAWSGVGRHLAGDAEAQFNVGYEANEVCTCNPASATTAPSRPTTPTSV